MSFYEWILNLKTDDLVMGDLITDISEDSTFPVDCKDHDRLYGYLAVCKLADQVVLEVFEKAWKLYKHSSKADR